MDINIIALLSPEGFDEKFWDKAAQTKTYKEAYEKVEEEYQFYFKKRRYSDYNSYRNCRDRRLKKATMLRTKKK